MLQLEHYLSQNNKTRLASKVTMTIETSTNACAQPLTNTADTKSNHDPNSNPYLLNSTASYIVSGGALNSTHSLIC